MPVLKSLIYGLKEARFNPVTVLHSAFYAATVTYLRILKVIVAIGPQRFRRHLGESYHSKVVRLEDARRLITINKDIEIRGLDQVLPYRYATDLILKNPHNIVVYECPCRAQKKDPCRPTDVCLVIGDPFVDLLRMFQPFRSRRITPEEALQILREEDERGHVHTAWFKHAMLDRFYAICNCCKCCCLGMKFMAAYQVKMILPSGFRAVIGDDCIGCGACVSSCQFDALEMVPVPDKGAERKRCRVIPERCYGCGICEGRCKQGAVSLIRDPDKGIPLNIESLAHTGAQQ